MVINNLHVVADLFNMTGKERLKAIEYANAIGYQSAKPSVIAIAIVCIAMPSLKHVDVRKKAKINFQTMEKWIPICRKCLNNHKAR